MADWTQFKRDIKPFVGIMAATLTPFTENFEVNYSLIPEYISVLEQQHNNGLFVNGTSGECYSLTVNERKQILETIMKTKEVIEGKLYIIAQVGCEAFSDVVELALHAQSLNVQGIAMLTPSFFTPKSHEQLAYIISEVANQVKETPFYYYHFPQRNAVNFPVHKTLTMARNLAKNIVGCKFTGVDCIDMGQISDNGFTVLIGYDDMLISGFAAGVQGAIGIGIFQMLMKQGFNVAGRLYRQIYDLFQEGKIQEAKKLQQISRVLFQYVLKPGLGATHKRLMKDWYGLEMGKVRWPQQDIDEAEYVKMLLKLEKRGIKQQLDLKINKRRCENILIEEKIEKKIKN